MLFSRMTKKMAAVKDEDFHVIDLNGDEETVSSEDATVNIPREWLEYNHQQKMVERCQVASPFKRKMRQVKQVILFVFICLIGRFDTNKNVPIKLSRLHCINYVSVFNQM